MHVMNKFGNSTYVCLRYSFTQQNKGTLSSVMETNMKF